MNTEDAAALLTYTNQIDPLVSLNEMNVDVWWEGLKHHDYKQAKWCVKDYYANTPPGRDGRTPSITPRALRERIRGKVEVADAGRRAIEPPPKHHHPTSYRAKNPNVWDQLVKQGRDDHLSEMVRRGIPLTPEQEEHY